MINVIEEHNFLIEIKKNYNQQIQQLMHIV